MTDSPAPHSALVDAAHALINGVPRLARLMRRDLRRHSAGLFTEPQFRVMAYLYREGAQCLSDLAEYQGVSLPTMSKLIQGLSSRELVDRRRDPEDRRRVMLDLTGAGREAYEALLAHTQAHIVEWIRPLSREQVEDVVRVFDLLVRRFDEVDLEAQYE